MESSLAAFTISAAGHSRVGNSVIPSPIARFWELGVLLPMCCAPLGLVSYFEDLVQRLGSCVGLVFGKFLGTELRRDWGILENWLEI